MSSFLEREYNMAMAMAMAMAMMRSVRRTSIRGGPMTPASKRTFASSARHYDAHEAEKWEKITYAGLAACTILAFYNLSKPHPHYEEPPPYPYLHIRNKDYPWGEDSLLEHIKKKKEKKD